MNKSDSIATLAAALVKAQGNIGGAVKGTANPFFKSRFASLGEVISACKSALLEQDIAVSQMPCVLPSGAPGLETILVHASGEWMSGIIPVICAKQNDPQAMGSAYTYARRYALQSALLIPAVDDDGEAAMFRQDDVTDRENQREATARKANDSPDPNGTHAQLRDWMEQDGISEEDFTVFLRQVKKPNGAPFLREDQPLRLLTDGEVNVILDDWATVAGQFITWKKPKGGQAKTRN